jgi:hypothetical protein
MCAVQPYRCQQRLQDTASVVDPTRLLLLLDMFNLGHDRDD